MHAANTLTIDASEVIVQRREQEHVGISRESMVEFYRLAFTNPVSFGAAASEISRPTPENQDAYLANFQAMLTVEMAAFISGIIRGIQWSQSWESSGNKQGKNDDQRS